MFDMLLWNTIYAAAFAVVLKASSYSRYLRQRPALMNLCWGLVLVKLITPAFVGIPTWTSLVSENYFRTADESTVVSRQAQMATIEAVARFVSQNTSITIAKEQQIEASNSPLQKVFTSKTSSDEVALSSVRVSAENSVFLLPRLFEGNLTMLRCIVALCWLIGSLAFLCFFWRQHRRIELISKCARTDTPLTALAARIGQSLGCRHVPMVVMLDANISPALLGCWRPIIVIPKWALEELNHEQIHAVLAHELAHFRRRDHWMTSLALLLRSVLWWNPLAWWATRELRQWQELSCDAMALSQSFIAPRAYGEALWRIVLRLQTQPTLATPALAVADRSGSFFRRRMRMLVDGTSKGKATKLGQLALVGIAAAAVCYPTAGAAMRVPNSFEYVVKPEIAPNYCEITGHWLSSTKVASVIDSSLGTDIVLRGHFWFGTTDKPVLVALTKRKSNDERLLLVDSDRNERLDEHDLAQPVGDQLWTAQVRVAASSIAPNGDESRKPDELTCTIMVRLVAGRLEIANAGRLEGTISLANRSLAATIEDRNCNGLWTDSEDRLHIDWNQDNSFSPLRERFSCQGSPTIDGHRYALAFLDDVLSLRPLEGTGFVSAHVNLNSETATIESCQAVLASTDGVHVTLSSLKDPIEVPVGKYSVKQLRLTLKDDRVWFASFEQSSSGKRTSVTVNRDGRVEFDLLGELTLSAHIAAGSIDAPRSGQVVVQPMLTSESGLYLSRSAVGKTVAQDDNSLTASLIQFGAMKKKLSVIESTGFGCGAFCPITFSGNELSADRSLIMLRFDSGPLAGVMTKTVGTQEVK